MVLILSFILPHCHELAMHGVQRLRCPRYRLLYQGPAESGRYSPNGKEPAAWPGPYGSWNPCASSAIGEVVAVLIKVPFAPVPQPKREGFHRLCLPGSSEGSDSWKSPGNQMLQSKTLFTPNVSLCRQLAQTNIGRQGIRGC